MPQKNFKNINSTLTFFRAASDLIDVLKRVEIRSDLLIKLEHQQKKLSRWLSAPNIDENMVSILIAKFEACMNALMSAPRIGQYLKEDRLITSARKRLSVPRGCCSFDLPALHLWRHLPDEDQSQYIHTVLDTLKPLYDALMMILNFIRQSCSLRSVNNLNGFFKGTADNAELLRLRIPSEYKLYPKISGHETLYVIHFVPLDPEEGHSSKNFSFELACC